MLSKLTLNGMSRYSDGHLWDNLNLPDGIDKEVFINEVLKRGGEFSMLYPDMDYMKYQIGAWSVKWAKTFKRWVTADNFEYEALFNLDVTSVHTEVGNNKESGSKSSSGTNSQTNAQNTSNTTDGGGSNTHSKAAYDSGTFQPTDLDESTNSVTLTGSVSNTSSGNTSGSETTSGSSEHSVTITETRRGNQGITMSQELLDAERNVWMWNIYSHMADLFINEYCICLYT